MIVLYTKSTCTPCQELKAWLNENEFEFKENSVEIESNLTYIKSLGVKTLPASIINGELIVGSQDIKIHLKNDY